MKCGWKCKSIGRARRKWWHSKICDGWQTKTIPSEVGTSNTYESVFSRRFSIKGKMPDYSSDCFFSSDYNPHTDWSTFLTILTILKSYNSYLANLKYWRKSLQSSIFTSSKKLKGTKGYFPLEYFLFFFEKKFPQKVPLQFFWSFPTQRMLKNPKGSHLSVFSALLDFFSKKFFSPKVPLLQFVWWFATEWIKNLKVSPLVRQFGSTFGFFRYRRREYFDTLKSFCCFWALDMAPNWAVPGLFRRKIDSVMLMPVTCMWRKLISNMMDKK